MLIYLVIKNYNLMQLITERRIKRMAWGHLKPLIAEEEASLLITILLTPNKKSPLLRYGQNQGENAPPNFMKDVSCPSHSSSIALDKVEDGLRESFPLAYSRIKLLAVYKNTKVTSLRKSLDGFISVPSLIKEESLKPLAFSAPTSEEMVILKGIDNGDIASSDELQVSKDGMVGRGTTDMVVL